ncbi:hypothetical protein CDL15_Pgr009187 [Punica granatum]|uniref:Uncharacterized protein n=1 Tax=Punica granatum TaxID=22663 RepID=A0A218WX59_PUNGR|nr:hypothetical protein CDL15_Pgr009187 [Punica granatum]PKI63928.1 hypothetical protein CRG98_015709 [Punica granatum]
MAQGPWTPKKFPKVVEHASQLAATCANSEKHKQTRLEQKKTEREGGWPGWFWHRETVACDPWEVPERGCKRPQGRRMLGYRTEGVVRVRELFVEGVGEGLARETRGPAS